MTLNSDTAQGSLLALSHRLLDVRDFLDRHEIPEHWHIHPYVSHDVGPTVDLVLYFESYTLANLWAWTHTRCHDSGRGYASKWNDDRTIFIELIDFNLKLVFPADTLDVLGMAKSL
jgi:hypothetical protein